MFQFSAASLILGMIFSGIGLIMLRLGKMEGDLPRILCGFALLIFPIVVGSTWITLALGIGLMFTPKLGEHFGLW